jgi:hypothetical protein
MASPAMEAVSPKITSSSVAATISDNPNPIWQNIQYNDLTAMTAMIGLDFRKTFTGNHGFYH